MGWTSGVLYKRVSSLLQPFDWQLWSPSLFFKSVMSLSIAILSYCNKYLLIFFFSFFLRIYKVTSFREPFKCQNSDTLQPPQRHRRPGWGCPVQEPHITPTMNTAARTVFMYQTAFWFCSIIDSVMAFSYICIEKVLFVELFSLEKY